MEEPPLPISPLLTAYTERNLAYRERRQKQPSSTVSSGIFNRSLLIYRKPRLVLLRYGTRKE